MTTNNALATSDNHSLIRNPAAAARYLHRARAANTLRVYRCAWREFTALAESRGEPALPASGGLVVDFLTGLADGGAKASTISVKLAGVAAAHRAARLPDPTTLEDVRLVMAGVRRSLKTRPAKKAPVSLDDLRAMVEILPVSLAGARARALLLLGWAGAFRRSELVGLDVADVRINGKLTVDIRQSKTDQEGHGLVKVIPALSDTALCPVAALKGWLDAAEIASGPIFRPIGRGGKVGAKRLTPQSVALIVKSSARAAGLDWRQLAGHSLRAGFITAAAGAGTDTRDIMALTGHSSEATMRGYIQDAGLGAMAAVRAAFGETEA